MEPVTYGKLRGAYATGMTGVKTKKSGLLAPDVNWPGCGPSEQY